MKNTRYNKAFTLIEVMLAAAILVIGLMLVAGAFPVGIKMTAIATERTIGTIAATEAFAKIKLLGDPNEPGQIPPYGVDLSQLRSMSLVDFEQTLQQAFVDPAEFDYPSADTGEAKLYHWTALLQRDGAVGRKVHAVVFVTRTAGAMARYPNPYYRTNSAIKPLVNTISIPKPIRVPIAVDRSIPPSATLIDEIVIADDSGTTFDETELAVHISDGAVLVTDLNEIILNVLEINRDPDDPKFGTIKLKEKIRSNTIGYYFWVIPTAIGSSRNPCIGVYQEPITF